MGSKKIILVYDGRNCRLHWNTCVDYNIIAKKHADFARVYKKKGKSCMKKSIIFKRALGVMLAGIMLFTAGCTNSTISKNNDKGAGEIPKELSVFISKVQTIGKDMTDFNDVLGFQMMEEATGCHVNWTLPPADGATEKFNLMIASGQYTDAIVYSWGSSTVNAKEYAEDGVILPLSDMIDECMPNFKKWCDENPEFAKRIKARGDGEIYYIPFIRTDKKLNIFLGPQMRTDWLENLGLEEPTNAQELYEVLKAFKTQDPNGNGIADEIPMTGVSSHHSMGLCALLWMFNTADEFYVDGNTVKFGALTDEFKEGLGYIAKLYKEGLIDPDYILQDRTKMDGKMTNGTAGFMYSYQPTKISNLMAEKDPSFRLEGIKHFENSDGVRKCYLTNYADSVLSAGLAISSTNPDPKGTLKWLDWIYSEEGQMAMNFGREGDTYTMVDGEPKFTEKVLKNPDGLTVGEAFGRFSGVYSTSDFPNLQDWRSYSQSLSPYGIAAIETWADGVDISGILPTLTFKDGEEELVKDVMIQVNTYVDEMIDKVIMGQESVEDWDKVVKAIKDMKVEEVVEIYQNAYDRYRGL